MAVLNEMLLQPSPLGEVFVSARDISGPSSYTTGGVTISANAFAMLSLKILISSYLTPDGTYFVRFINKTGPGSPTQLILWYVTSTGAEVTAATDLSAERIRILALGN